MPQSPQLSIIIPTFNRKELLGKVLDGYSRQTSQSQTFEIFVVDDGSTDGTGPAVAAFMQNSPLAIRYLSQKNSGPAAARNYGIREAKGDVILFGDDDIIPAPDLVAQHAAWHARNPAANFSMLGHVDWSPDVHPTPFMEWMGRDGVLFGFNSLQPGKEASFHYFYSCNLSIKRIFLIENGMFDESFPRAAHEDIELGYRLANKGLHLIYNRGAIGYHYKYFSYADACRRQEGLFAARAFFETTEAGQAMKALAAQSKPPTLKRRLKLAGAKVVTPLLVPLVPLLDTQIRLPRIIYSLVYFFHAAPRAQVRYEASLVQQGKPRAS